MEQQRVTFLILIGHDYYSIPFSELISQLNSHFIVVSYQCKIFVVLFLVIYVIFSWLSLILYYLLSFAIYLFFFNKAIVLQNHISGRNLKEHLIDSI